MLFCQMGRAHSLREIVGGLRSCEGKLKHLGITAPHRSTLAYANGHRPWQLYESNLVALLRMNLFTHRDLWAWLNHPFEIDPILYEPEQLSLGLG